MQTNCIDMLRADHMKVELMLVRLRMMKNPQMRRQLSARIRAEVLRHMKLEEDYFYPASSHVKGLRIEVEDSYDEHKELRSMLEDLAEMNPRSIRYNAALTELIIKFEHHVITEENSLFPQVLKKMDRTQFQRLNRQMMRQHEKQDEEPQISKAA